MASSMTAFVLRIVTTAGLLVSLFATACSDREPPHARSVESSPDVEQATATVNPPLRALLVVGKTAEDLFDAARRENWPAAELALKDMHESAAGLPANSSKPELAVQLLTRLEGAADLVSTRQRLQTMDLANGMTRLV